MNDTRYSEDNDNIDNKALHINSLDSSPCRNKDGNILSESTIDTHTNNNVHKLESSTQDLKGRIEFLGLWKDTEDRAIPIQLNVNTSNPNQIIEGVQKLIQNLSQIPDKTTKSGIISFQNYNQISWSTLPNDEGYKKHGFISMDSPSMAHSTQKVHLAEGITIQGLEGKIDILGGD